MKRKAPILDGLRVRNRLAQCFFETIALHKRPSVAYWVLSQEERTDLDRRAETRRRTHLQSGKIVVDDDRFLVECLILDRTPAGLRLRLSRPVDLPASFQLYDDRRGTLIRARVIWRRGRNIGCRVAASSITHKEKLMRKLKAPHYGVQ